MAVNGIVNKKKSYADEKYKVFNTGMDANQIRAAANKSFSTSGFKTLPTSGGIAVATPKTYEGPSLSDLYGSLYGATGSSSGSGGGGKVDLTNMLAAYDKAAEAARQTTESTYNTTRNDLLTSLKRFQENNAKQVESQKRAYLTGQANLESARAEADRQNRISASARGLGGSGLQQLSQLQNLLNQSQDISELALENQNVMENLRTALANQEEDINTKLANAATARDNALKTIEAERAANKANLEYQAAENAASRAATYRSSQENLAAQAAQEADLFNSNLSTIMGKYNRQATEIMNDKKMSNKQKREQIKTLKDAAELQVDELVTNFGGYNTKEVQSAYDTLASVYDTSVNKFPIKESFWNYLGRNIFSLSPDDVRYY